ncbi:archaeosortase/exosortase family protein [Amycolatopsis sp. ATCC 39116]|uniref:exosortase/archaeosortase family protein n=1 Tax=Amycolatopsis sp. (strain ATCC 39116 / 75iv2) TaxID=385957 RepID=UPI00026274F3|nr:archaeosortase/exosortase family protein [Amycolatopsis sp. ATCC 39116]
MTSESAAVPWSGIPANPSGHTHRSWLGWLAAALCFGVAVALIAFQDSYRIFETWLAGELVTAVSGQFTFAVPGHPVLYFRTSASPGVMGINVSLACSSALLVAPLFLTSGALFLSRARSRVRLVLATLLGFLIIAVANNIRLMLIVMLGGRFGETGLDWGHVLIGSLVMLTAGGVAILLYIRITTGRRREADGR